MEPTRGPVPAGGCGRAPNGLSCLSVAGDFDDGAQAGREHVLAMRWLRWNLERRAAGVAAEQRRLPLALNNW